MAVKRWFSTCVAQPEFADVLGPTAMLCAEGAAPLLAAAPAAEGKKEKALQEKKEKAGEGGEEEGGEEAEGGEEEGGEEGRQARWAVGQGWRRRQKIIKEGGKKGVEIEGASDMGGLDFFCTTMELPEGNIEYLELSMLAMNAEPDPEAEDRKGCSGHIGKMIFSAASSSWRWWRMCPTRSSTSRPTRSTPRCG